LTDTPLILNQMVRATGIEGPDLPQSGAMDVCDLFTRNRLKGGGKGGESRLK